MVKIRLKRMGTTKRPFYRLVVADSRSPRDGRFIEALGFYDPLPQPASVRIDADRVREWLRRGARPSDSARDLLVAQGILAAGPHRERPAVPATEPAAAETPAAPAPKPRSEPALDAAAAPAAESAIEPEVVAAAEPPAEAEPAPAAAEADGEVAGVETAPAGEDA